MGLSERERQVLAQMEQQLRGEDPTLVSTLATDEDEAVTPTIKAGPRAWAVAITVAVIGLILLLVGVSLSTRWVGTLVGIVGFLLMLGGLLMPFSEGVVRFIGGPNAIVKKAPKKTGSFMERQERKWDQRHNR